MELCSVEGCGRPLEAAGLCRSHRRRKDKGLPINVPIREKKAGRACSYPGCDRSYYGKGWCTMHYQRVRAGKLLDDPVQVRIPGRGCSVEGCSRPHEGHGLCNTHLLRLRRGKPLTDPPKVRTEGSTRMNSDGYVDEKRYGQWIRQHRLRMEELLGRRLLPHESVHHINGQRDDNRVDGPLVNFRSGNLELWSQAHPCGQRVEDKIEFALEILRLYQPEYLTA